MKILNQGNTDFEEKKGCSGHDDDKCLYYCNYSKQPHPKQPYLIFAGGPKEVRNVCGKVLIGPFLLQSNFTCYPHVAVNPICVCDDDFYVSVTDPCGTPICPITGQKFYIAICTSRKFFCFEVKAFGKLFSKNKSFMCNDEEDDRAAYAETYADADFDGADYADETENQAYFAGNTDVTTTYAKGVSARICVCVNLNECKAYQPQPPKKKPKVTVYQPKDCLQHEPKCIHICCKCCR